MNKILQSFIAVISRSIIVTTLISATAYAQVEAVATAPAASVDAVASEPVKKPYDKSEAWKKHRVAAWKTAKSSTETSEQMGSNPLVKIIVEKPQPVNPQPANQPREIVIYKRAAEPQQVAAEDIPAPVKEKEVTKKIENIRPVQEQRQQIVQQPRQDNFVKKSEPQRVENYARKSEKNSGDLSIRPYVGVDGLWSHVNNTYVSKKNPLGTYSRGDLYANAQSYGFGLNLGVKLRSKSTGLFTAVELFYDDIGNKTRSPLLKTNTYDPNDDWSSLSQADSIRIHNRFGAKMYLGFQPMRKLDVFATVGLVSVRYSVITYAFKDWYESKGFHGDNYVFSAREIAPIFGGGISYSINDDWDVKTLYEHQSIGLRAAGHNEIPGEIYKSEIDTVKIGISRNF